MTYRDSNHYEVAFHNDTDDLRVGGPLDDRDSNDPEFTVEDELAYNLDVEMREV